MSEIALSKSQKQVLRDAMLRAGRVIMQVRADGQGHDIKGDGSPVTLADTRAETILLATLNENVPHIPVVAEEAAEAGDTPDTVDTFFLVDPLDGTKEFIKGGTDFTVNIGLIHDGRPVFGMIYVPATGRYYEGMARAGAWSATIDCQQCEHFIVQKRYPIKSRRAKKDDLIAIASRSHRSDETNDWLDEHKVKTTISAGSSLKFCLLAEGKADVYPRHGPTMEWDTAAGHAILSAAGGRVETLDGKSFLYGKKDQKRPYLNPGFIAYGQN